MENENTDINHVEQQPKNTVPISFFQLFRYAQGTDYILIIVGLLSAWILGLAIPTMNILYGKITNDFVNHDFVLQNLKNHQCNNTRFHDVKETDFIFDLNTFAIGMVVLGILQFVFSSIMVTCLNISAEKQIRRIRGLFLQSILQQDIGWHDTNKTGGFSSQDLTELQDGIGEKLGMFHYFLATFIFCIITGVIYGWELTLVMLSVTPVIILAMFIIRKIQFVIQESELNANRNAREIANEVILAIKTVVAFGGESKEVERYDEKLAHAASVSIKSGLLSGIGGGILWFLLFCGLTLTFWFGVTKGILKEGNITSQAYDPASVIVVFSCVYLGSLFMAQTAPYIDTFSKARVTAASVFSIIDMKPEIDISSSQGEIPANLLGDIEFDNVYFSYPTRKDTQILNGFSLKINSGETVAIVGETGSGKSTIIQLLQRFYDPTSGHIKVDGYNLNLLNLGWLRNNIGFVSQEPVLFGDTIAQNIQYGRNGTMGEVLKAAKQAFAHNFINKLPMKYETQLGDNGTQLSGGQKQRVAIARAMIRNPKILLLDEATSALDVESEGIVQEALEQARKGRTTIIIAHRLSTIRTADRIAFLLNGRIVEIGTHEELMNRNENYCRFVNAQMKHSENEKNEENHSETKNPNIASNEIKTSQKRPSPRKEDVSAQIEKNDSDVQSRSTWLKVLKQNQPEWKYIVFGCIGALGMGFGMPAYAVTYGDIMGTFSICDDEQMRKEAIFYICMFLVTGVFVAISNFLQVFMFSCSGELLSRRLRKLTFATILKQEMSWFDNPENSIGSLCTRLSDDVSSILGITGPKFGNNLQAVCTFLAFAIISLFLSWKMALAGMATVPLLLLSAYLENKVITLQSTEELKSFEKANSIASEVISNIRTVASLHTEETFLKFYMQNLHMVYRNAAKRTHICAAIFGFANAVPNFTLALAIWYGGYLIINEALSYENVFKISELQYWGTIVLCQAFAVSMDVNRAIVSASRIFKLIERKSLIDSSTESGLQLPESTPARIEFKQVKFHYPNRPDVHVLHSLDLSINPGEVVAIVGSSGCGKSTCLQLLERFYDPVNGKVTIDNTDIDQLNIRWLRSKMAIVSQEPTLFDSSIAANIAYGDNSQTVSMSEIIDAATKANIHSFITSLPQGYETPVGKNGIQLSGGQKQRIAIARALIRNPKILLLDEATSALDTESEKIVQEALEKAQKGRTCIVVAHRLSTIRNASQIAVIHEGEIVEIGTHQELINIEGHYFNFYNIQRNQWQ